VTEERVDLLEILRHVRRAAGDMRKVFLALYGLLITVPVGLAIVGAGRAALLGGLGREVLATLLRPARLSVEFVQLCAADGRWFVLASVAVGIWLAAVLVGSFFGLAITRMTAIELTCQRRADVSEALRFARAHWHWGFLTPASLAVGALLLLGLAAALVSLGRLSEYLIVVAAPIALFLILGAVVLLLGLLAGGLLAWPAIATEWSDAFDAISRAFSYSFAHGYRAFAYRIGGGLVLLGTVATRAFRAGLAILLFFLALVAGLGMERTTALIGAVLLEPPEGLPLPQTLAGWTLLTCTAIYLTLLVARLVVYRLALRQALYLLLRLRVDRTPLDNIDGYRPDDSDYDPTAQGFELVEVEEEIPAE